MCQAEEDAGAVVQCVIAGGSEVQLGFAQSSIASDISEIEHPTLQGVQTLILYSTIVHTYTAVRMIVPPWIGHVLSDRQLRIRRTCTKPWKGFLSTLVCEGITFTVTWVGEDTTGFT